MKVGRCVFEKISRLAFSPYGYLTAPTFKKHCYRTSVIQNKLYVGLLTCRPEPPGGACPLLGGLLVLGRVGLDGQAAGVGRRDEAELDRRRRDLVRHGLEEQVYDKD